jgi:hypothetical protein
MKQRTAKNPATSKVRLMEALDRLIELAEASGKVEDAKMWKGEKAKITPAANAPSSAADTRGSSRSRKAIA